VEVTNYDTSLIQVTHFLLLVPNILLSIVLKHSSEYFPQAETSTFITTQNKKVKIQIGRTGISTTNLEMSTEVEGTCQKLVVRKAGVICVFIYLRKPMLY
jgi:hypothetical protein